LRTSLGRLAGLNSIFAFRTNVGGTGAGAAAIAVVTSDTMTVAMSAVEGVARAGGTPVAEGIPGGADGKPLGSSTMLVP